MTGPDRDELPPLPKPPTREDLATFPAGADRFLHAGGVVERVARTLAKEAGRADPHAWPQYVGLVRTMIGALREPTSAMLKGGVDAIQKSHGDRIDAFTAEAGWQAMIDAALAE